MRSGDDKEFILVRESVVTILNNILYMAKNFSRYTMRANMLRKVLIRIDYDGVTDINEWIKLFKENRELSSYFQKYTKGVQNQATISLSNMEEIAASRSIPLSTIQSEPLHRFSDAVFKEEDGIQREDKVVMDVTSLFLTFSIDCVNYKNMDVYIDFLNNYIKSFLENDKYIVIQRIGVRKLGGDVFRSIEDCSETFESSVFAPLDVANLDGGLIDREYVDRIIRNDDSVKVNFARRCRAIKTDDGETVYQALLDIDGYVDNGLIEKNNYRFPNDFEYVVKTTINDYLFELYKLSVTEQYLKDNGKEV